MKALSGKRGRWLGPVDEAVVLAAEERLGLPFPAQYRRFVLEYGSGIVGSHEIYGFGGPEVCVPSLIWLVDDLQRVGLKRPAQLLPFHAEGDGAYSAVLAAPLAGYPTGAVVYWSPHDDDTLEVELACLSLEAWFDARVG